MSNVNNPAGLPGLGRCKRRGKGRNKNHLLTHWPKGNNFFVRSLFPCSPLDAGGTGFFGPVRPLVCAQKKYGDSTFWDDKL